MRDRRDHHERLYDADGSRRTLTRSPLAGRVYTWRGSGPDLGAVVVCRPFLAQLDLMLARSVARRLILPTRPNTSWMRDPAPPCGRPDEGWAGPPGAALRSSR